MPEQQQKSNLQLYSLGIVTEDKVRNSDTIKVTPIENLHMVEGDLSTKKFNYDIKMPDNKGVKKSDKLEGKATIEAKWLPFGQSNLISVPDVIKNETVILLRFADSEEYHWTTIFSERNIRRLETMVLACGDKKEGNEPWDKNSSYYLEVNTIDKHITLATNKSDGEKFKYEISMKPREGLLEIKDDSGNKIVMDSKSNEITIGAEAINVTGGNRVSLSAENITLDGIVSINGNTSINGNLSVSGDVNAGGWVTSGRGDLYS